MDMMQDDFFDEVPVNGDTPAQEDGAESVAVEGGNVALPFPSKDYDKKGRLKKVRGRVLKKLLKSEWRYYALFTGVLMAFVVVMGVIFGLVSRKGAELDMTGEYVENSGYVFAGVITLLLFILTCSGAILFAQIYPVARYNKNFFQNEGYLTFSVPASMEEHIFAKRIAAVLCNLGIYLAVALSVTLALVLSGGMADIEGELFFYLEIFGAEYFSFTAGEKALVIIETAVSALIALFLLPAAYGAVSCVLSKLSGNKKTGTILLLIFLAVGLAETLLSSLLVFGTDWLPATEVGRHISTWITIVLQAGLAVGCTAFEIFYLKRKLDLK